VITLQFVKMSKKQNRLPGCT